MGQFFQVTRLNNNNDGDDDDDGLLVNVIASIRRITTYLQEKNINDKKVFYSNSEYVTANGTDSQKNIKAPANEETLLRKHSSVNVSPFAHKRNICCRNIFCS